MLNKPTLHINIQVVPRKQSSTSQLHEDTTSLPDHWMEKHPFNVLRALSEWKIYPS